MGPGLGVVGGPEGCVHALPDGVAVVGGVHGPFGAGAGAVGCGAGCWGCTAGAGRAGDGVGAPFQAHPDPGGVAPGIPYPGVTPGAPYPGVITPGAP